MIGRHRLGSETLAGEFFYNPPSLVVTAPTGIVTTTQPFAEWTHTPSVVDGGPQDRYRMRLFTAAQFGVFDFDPETSIAFSDSGVVFSTVDTVQVDAFAGAGTYRVYVRTAQTVAGVTQWSAWAYSEFTVAGVDVPIVAFTDSVYGIDFCVGWNRIGECVNGVLDGVVRELAIGEWRLTGPVSAQQLQAGYTLADVDTIRVTRDRDVVFGGFVTPIGSGTGGLEISSSGEGEQFTLTGPDLWGVLAARVCYPTPSTGPPWAASHNVRTGIASTCAAGYVLNNAGSAAIADRQTPGLTVTDLAVGAVGAWSARLQPLDLQVARVCQEGGITCRLTVNFAGTVNVLLTTATNRSASVVLSDQGDLTRIQQIHRPASTTFVIAGGQGTLAARTFATAGTAVGAARRERFFDNTNLSTAPEVAQAATAQLALSAATLTVRSQISDMISRLRYLIEYDVGDSISVEIDGVRYVTKIDAVTIHVAATRSAIRPVLGDAIPNLVSALIADVAGLQNQSQSQIA